MITVVIFGNLDIQQCQIVFTRIDRRNLIMSDILTVEPLFIRDQDIRSSNVTAFGYMPCMYKE